MCGLAGVVGHDQSLISSGIDRMLKSLVHRGPDDFGVLVLDGAKGFNIGLGHRRLSILDLTSGGHQPMSSNDLRYSIVFNGEIYNYVEIRQELEDVYDFKSKSDTEVLLACYIVYGVEMLDKLDGMFAFLIFDKQQNTIFAARDIIGIKPFYFCNNRDHFWFASEPAALLAGTNTDGRYDPDSLSNFLLFGISDQDHRTTLHGISQLRGGHYIYQDIDSLGDGIDQKSYWEVPEIKEQSLSTSQEEYRDVLRLSVSRQLRSDVKLGSSLSGGIDSGAIVLTAGKLTKANREHYSTITFSFPDFPGDEAAYAKQVSKEAGFDWFAVTPDTTNISEDLTRMIISMGEPFSTLSMFAQYKVMEKAQDLGIKVMLDGQGGDEVNLGYPRVAQLVMWEYLKSGDVNTFLNEWIGFKRNANIPLWKSLAWYIYFNSATVGQNRKLRTVSQWVDRDYLDAYDRELAADVFKPCSVYERQNKELRKYILPRLLRYADRNSMAFSVESRVPHLSKPMLDFALSVPYSHRVRNGYTKFLERSSLDGAMPDDILWNPVKKGFDVPQAYWIEILMPAIQTWLEAVPQGSPYKIEAIRAALKSDKKASPYLWRVVSSLALVALKNYEVN